LHQPQELPYVATFRFSESTLAYFYFISCYFPLIFSPPNKQTKKEKQSKLKKTGEKLKKIEGGRGNGGTADKTANFGDSFSVIFWPNCFLLMPKRENKTFFASHPALSIGDTNGLKLKWIFQLVQICCRLEKTNKIE